MKTSRNTSFSAIVLFLGALAVLVTLVVIVKVEASLPDEILVGALAAVTIGLVTGFIYWLARALEENEERLRVFVESAYDGIITTDAFGTIETVNPSVSTMFGYRPGQLIGEHLSVIFSSAHGERREYENFKEFLMRTNIAELGVPHEVHGLRQDGRQFHMDVSTTHARVGRDSIYTVMVRDVTARVAALKVLRKAKEELEKRVRERTTALEETNARLEAEMEERTKLIDELQSAISEIQTLSGMLPICASCKKIRDDKGYWNQIEVYIREHSQAEFSHGICPDCVRELYPEFDQANRES